MNLRWHVYRGSKYAEGILHWPAPLLLATNVALILLAASIGIATMDGSGTIVLQLGANEGGIHGHARLVYPPTHPEYTNILRHLGGLTPGESKPVPPWPDPVNSPARSSDSSR
jgi:hypothetical protein